jgi:GNAT superfamily N-acetyltransferase
MALITPARTDAEIEQVRSLLRAYRSELPVQVCFADYDKEVEGLPGNYAEPRGAVLLATISVQPAGCVCLRPLNREGVCEMKRLYVLPHYRGDSLGRQLIERILDEARRRKYRRLRLDTHPPTMQAAVALYRRFGFTELASVENAISGLMYMELDL